MSKEPIKDLPSEQSTQPGKDTDAKEGELNVEELGKIAGGMPKGGGGGHVTCDTDHGDGCDE